MAPTPVPAKMQAGRCPHVPMPLILMSRHPYAPHFAAPPLPIPTAGQRAIFALMQWLCFLLLSELKNQVPC